MSEEKIFTGDNNVSQALEDARSQYADPGESQTERSKRAVLEEIRAMIRENPEMSNKEIALQVGSTPKQVGNQRYLMGETDKAPNPREAGYENPRKKAAKKEDANGKAPRPPKLIAVVKQMTYIGAVAEYTVEDGEVYIRIVNEVGDSTVPVARLDELIQELNALKKEIEGNGASKHGTHEA